MTKRSRIISIFLFLFWASHALALSAETISPALRALVQAPQTTRATTILPRGQATITITADRLDKLQSIWVAEGKVDITYGDMRLQADRVEYNEDTHYAIASGNVILTRRLQRFIGSRIEYDIDSETGRFYDVSGSTDRDFFIQAKEIEMTGRDTYRIEHGFITACKEAAPKWSFAASRARINVQKRATIRNSVFRIKKIPVFYFPIVTVPLEKSERSSGFLSPSTGTSTIKGRTLSGAFYLTLGRSADSTLFGDYFSKRGIGYGIRFRTKPNDRTWFNLTSYSVHDRGTPNAGGTSVAATGQTFFRNGFRGVANVSLVTNFLFRQVFSDSFRAATNAFENSTVFLTNNFDAFSSNFLYSRRETFFPFPSIAAPDEPTVDRRFRDLRNAPTVVIRNAPMIGFKSLGRRIGSLPVYFFFDASLEGMHRNRVQKLGASEGPRLVQMPPFVQRFDVFPRLTLPLRSLAGISLAPTVGVRETFYGNSFAPGDVTRVSSQNIHRKYFTFELVSKGPGLAKIYRDSKDNGKFKHLIEPEVTYRYITPIDEFNRIIRFDEKDAIASTNEFEYGLVNRIFTKRWIKEGEPITHEIISFRLSQKYFFDPTFGGALIPGQPNQFFPLNTLTPFIYGGVVRRFSPLVANLRLSLTPGYSADFRADYDSRFQRLRNASVAGYLNTGKIFLATTYFFTREILITRELIERGTFNSNQMQSQIAYGNPLRGLATAFTVSYDIRGTRINPSDERRKRHLLNSVGRINYNWDCCGVAFEFLQFSVGPRVETLFRFSFTLKGIGSFGTLRRPESLF